jgi:hypothetical protein
MEGEVIKHNPHSALFQSEKVDFLSAVNLTSKAFDLMTVVS